MSYYDRYTEPPKYEHPECESCDHTECDCCVANGTAKPEMRLIDAEALKKDFEERYKACDEWIEKAKDEEIKIRADATKHFICEVIMTIDNAPTVESDYEWGYSEGVHDTERPQGEWIVSEYIDTNRGYVCKCPFCKEDTVGGGNFCPNCGAKMQKGGAE